jgi:hypothetical protein
VQKKSVSPKKQNPKKPRTGFDGTTGALLTPAIDYIKLRVISLA